MSVVACVWLARCKLYRTVQFKFEDQGELSDFAKVSRLGLVVDKRRCVWHVELVACVGVQR